MVKTAIIGTGIAGMGCGYFLHGHEDLTFYEQNDYIGGHTNTVVLDEEEGPVYIDTGFMVFNYRTYPHLCRLFERIKAPVKKTDMSFSVQHLPSGLEYSGSGISHLFAQRSNLFNVRYWKMLWQIRRFNSESIRILDNPKYANYSLGQYVKEFNFGDDMLWKYLVPMSSAVWSTPMKKMLDFPAVTLIRFFQNHGFLGLNTQHQWYTPDRGSQSYREILIRPFRDRIRVNHKVVKIIRQGVSGGGEKRGESEFSAEGSRGANENGDGVLVVTEDGVRERYDRVILACHGDQALALLDQPTRDERRLLGHFSYQHNRAVVHTDAAVMPRKKLAWSSWNYRIQEREGQLVPSTIYWMNQLQGLPGKKDYFVSINPHSDLDANKIIRSIDYEHPLFDIAAIEAQKELHLLNNKGPVFYCGSYFKYGFHEDAFRSALELCAHIRALKIKDDIWAEASTIHL